MIKIGRKIKNVIERDRRIIFTTTREEYPLVPDRTDGEIIYDIEGNKFVDFTSFISVYSFGTEGINIARRAVHKQVDKLMHAAFTDFYSPLPVSAAEKLVSLLPHGFGRVFFSNSGTEANEDAIKLARLFTKRQYILGFYNSFHGRSTGPLGITSSKVAQRHGFGPFPNVIHAVYPYTYRCAFNSKSPEECADNCLRFIEEFIFRKIAAPDEIAAILFEPIQGEGGYIVPPKEFITGLRKLASDNGIVLIADEVQSGVMRAGKFVALDNFGVAADIYTFAKAIGAGLPLGATVAKRSFGDTPVGSHAGTFGGNLAAVAASNALLDYIKANRLRLESMAKKKGSMLMKRLKEMESGYEIVGEARGMGMMLAIEIVKEKGSKKPAPKERNEILNECFTNGLVLLPAGESSIRIIPAITMSEENLEKGMEILEGAVKKEAAKAR
ncbi:MAG: aminotransferase class III-fold pyridoxal phosphate-dependent enzyme [Candidatus Micrarchaeaceae archaeon]